MHLPARMDGGPHQPIAPGQTWSPTWKIDQPTATLWYHPHPHGESAQHVYRGLAGMFIIDDGRAGLPSGYGVDDFPIIVQDKNFDDGRLDEGRSVLGDVGVLGDTIAVNGVIGPYLEVTTSLVRLRLLNASNARLYNFAFADERDFQLVGTDGGLLETPLRINEIQLAVGERAEIVVPVTAGETVVLRSGPQDLGIGALGDRFVGGHDRLDILQLRAVASLEQSAPVPARLAEIERLDPKQAAQSRQFRVQSRTINGRRMDMGRVDATIVKGSTEIWTVTNNDGTPHSFHLHDVQFQILKIGGRTPPPQLSGWKDTVFLRVPDPVTLIARFADYSDPNTPYMFHCHVLLHEDEGMMGQFVVVEPGQQAGPIHSH
jgi:FtsP/CotA-like multicopper oxidase with cupredoxin domain